MKKTLLLMVCMMVAGLVLAEPFTSECTGVTQLKPSGLNAIYRYAFRIHSHYDQWVKGRLSIAAFSPHGGWQIVHIESLRLMPQEGREFSFDNKWSPACAGHDGSYSLQQFRFKFDLDAGTSVQDVAGCESQNFKVELQSSAPF